MSALNEQDELLWDEAQEIINEALQRIVDSPPEDTVALAVSFMASIDLLGPAARHVTVAEFFQLFTVLYRNLTAD